MIFWWFTLMSTSPQYLQKSNCQINENKESKLFFFSKRSIQMNVRFKRFCTIFWLKHNRKKYFFIHKSQFAVSMAELEHFEIKFVSCWFHIYRDIWNPKLSQLLEVFHEQGNIHDPFAMACEVRSATVLTTAVIGHIPREISCFFYFLWNMVVS